MVQAAGFIGCKGGGSRGERVWLRHSVCGTTLGGCGVCRRGWRKGRGWVGSVEAGAGAVRPVTNTSGASTGWDSWGHMGVGPRGHGVQASPAAALCNGPSPTHGEQAHVCTNLCHKHMRTSTQVSYPHPSPKQGLLPPVRGSSTLSQSTSSVQ